MRRKPGSMLLGGATRTAALTLAALLTTALPAVPLAAQGAAATAAQPAARSHLDVAITYDATLANAITSSRFWMQGGSVQVHGQFYRGLGVVADVAGMHVASINSTGVGLDMVTATFGPRYTWQPAHARYSVFAQALAGEANGFHGLFPRPKGAQDSYNSLAVEAGGGLNVNLSPHLAVRAIEGGWLRTQLPNSTGNVQNNMRLGAGVVLRLW